MCLAAYVGAVAAVAAGIGHVLPHFMPVPSEAASMPARTPADWIDAARPYPAFALVMSEFEGTESHYVIRRRPDGGRKDIMSFGDLAGPSHFRIEIDHAAAAQERFAATATEIVARIADPDTVQDMRPAGVLKTRFGPLRLVELTLYPVSGPRRCLGFARAFEATPVQIAGTYCRAGSDTVEPGALACALDRLTFLDADAEPQLAALFAPAEIRRNACGQAGSIRVAAPRRGTWIDSAREPKLRGAL
jgi:hypothetical protein